jgi:hypothetical protein
MLQDNVVLDPVSATPIVVNSNGPTFLLDNIFRIRAGAAKAPVVKQTPPGGPSDLISIGNTYSVADPLEVTGRTFTLDDKVVGPAAIKNVALQLPDAEPNRKRTVIEVAAGADAAAIQAAIDKAAKLNGQRPVVHLPGGSYSIASTLVIPANADLQLVGDGYLTNLKWTGTGAGPMLRLQGPSRATLREFEADAGPTDWVPKPDAAAAIVVENADQPGSRIFMEGALAENFSQVGTLVDHLKHTEIAMRDNELNFNAVGIRVLGQMADGRVAIWSGITGDNGLTYDLDEGGAVLVRDTWYEGSPMRFVHLKGRGSLTLSGAMVASGRPGPNATPTDPSYYGVDIDNFQGDVTFVSTMFSTRMNVHGDGANTNVLVIGSNADPTEPWNNNSPKAHVAVMNSQILLPNGDVPIDNKGTADADFIRKMLKPLRSEKPRELAPIAAGKTDLRFYRVFVRFGSTGYHFKPGQ